MAKNGKSIVAKKAAPKEKATAEAILSALRSVRKRLKGRIEWQIEQGDLELKAGSEYVLALVEAEAEKFTRQLGREVAR